MMPELLFNLLLALAVILYLVAAGQLPESGDSLDTLGASGFPLMIGVAALLVMAGLTARLLRQGNAAGSGLRETPLPDTRLMLVNVGMLAGYILLLNVLGFAVSTLLYLFIAPTTFGYSNWQRLGMYALIGSIALVVVFGTVFFVPLPRGIGVFRELSYLVY